MFENKKIKTMFQNICISVKIYMYTSHKKKTVENSQISQYFARKIEILHLHFCRHF